MPFLREHQGIPREEFEFIMKMRREYAAKLSAYEANPTDETSKELADIVERRERAFRMLNSDGYSIRTISALFKTSKTAVREATGAKKSY